MWKRRNAMKTGLLIGAAAMYLFDPEQGEERRQALLDRVAPWLEQTTLAPLLDGVTANGAQASGPDEGTGREVRSA